MMLGESDENKDTAQEDLPNNSGKVKLTQRNSFKRVVSGAVYAVLTIGCLLLSIYSTVVLISIMAGLCAFEFYRMMHGDGKNPNDVIGIAAAVLYPVAAALGAGTLLVSLTLILMAVLLVWYVFSPRARISDLALTAFGALYCGLMFSCLVLIRKGIPGIDGGVLVCAVVVSVWANDATAYLIGSLIGKHKMAPKVSPKKSWEGFFAGIVGSLVIWSIVPTFLPSIGYPSALAAGLLCGVIAVFGDFVESRIKRGAGVKDSGTIMPGHGGMLDRNDSLIFVAVIAFMVLKIEGVI